MTGLALLVLAPACANLATAGLKAKYSTVAKVGSSPSIAVTIRR